MVRAVAVASGPEPASLTAWTLTGTATSSPNPASVTDVPVTSWVLPPASTTYVVIGRPLSAAACQLAWIAPRWPGSVAAVRLRGRSGAANGTTVLLSGDGWLPALRSLTVTTVNA